MNIACVSFVQSGGKLPAAGRVLARPYRSSVLMQAEQELPAASTNGVVAVIMCRLKVRQQRGAHSYAHHTMCTNISSRARRAYHSRAKCTCGMRGACGIGHEGTEQELGRHSYTYLLRTSRYFFDIYDNELAPARTTVATTGHARRPGRRRPWVSSVCRHPRSTPDMGTYVHIHGRTRTMYVPRGQEEKHVPLRYLAN